MGHIPLRWRLKAWWEGYDIADMEKKFREHLAKKAAKRSGRRARIKGGTVKLEKKDGWNKARVKITQLVWGEGYCGPGGPENIISMAKALNLSPQKSILVVGAGLGGPARVLCRDSGVWINAYESSKQLALEAQNISVNEGLDKKVQIRHVDLNRLSKFPRFFDNVFSKDTFFTIRKKEDLLLTIYDHLKKGGLFLMTDFVLDKEDDLQDADLQNWMDKETTECFPVTSQVMTELMTRCGYTVRVHEDITDHYLSLVTEAWADADKLVAFMASEKNNSRENLDTIYEESQYWSRRIKLMQRRKLRVFRYLLQK